jgi:hypothetical protein
MPKAEAKAERGSGRNTVNGTNKVKLLKFYVSMPWTVFHCLFKAGGRA